MAENNQSRSTLRTNTLIGLFVSLGLALGKLLAGVIGQSTALLADAIESIADAVGSILVWQGLRVAERPADDSHPYGYGKAEAIASLGVSVLLIIAAGYIVFRAFHEIVVPHPPPSQWTLLVIVTVILIKETLFRIVIRGATEFDSDAARADAWHHRSDAITSLAAFFGVATAVWGPHWLNLPSLVLADEVAAMLASGVVVMTAWSLMRPALIELLDATSHTMAERVLQVASQVNGVEHIEKVWVRKSGSGYHVDMHLHVARDLTIAAAHNIAGHTKAVLRSEIPSIRSVLIHVEPSEEAPSH